MPIDVDGGLICSGGRGLGAITSVYCERRQPGERLDDHQNPEHPREPRHDLHASRVLLTQRLIAKAGCRQPAQRLRLGLLRGLLIELAIELPGVDRELQLPWREEHGGNDEPQDQRHQRDPSPSVETMRAHRRRTEKRRHERVSGCQLQCLVRPLGRPWDQGTIGGGR